VSESPTHSRAQGLHPADALAPTHRELEEHLQHQGLPAEPERDFLTPAQAQGLLTRARIRAPFDGKIILLNDSKTITLEVESTIRWQVLGGTRKSG
jgi:hypothetical protein